VIEKELKALLSESKHRELLAQFYWDKIIAQTNYYFSDNNGGLEDKNITVRVREINGAYTLQIKTPISEEKALHIKEEFEEPLTALPEMVSSNQLKTVANLSVGDALYNRFAAYLQAYLPLGRGYANMFGSKYLFEIY